MKTEREKWLEKELKKERKRKKKVVAKRKETQSVNRNDWLIQKSIEFKDELTENATKAEKILLNRLHKSKWAEDVVFQYPIYIKGKNDLVKNFYIVDFMILSLNLIIEVDGGYHSEKKQKEKDIKREDALAQEGYITIRVNNADILEDTSCISILKRIESYSTKS